MKRIRALSSVVLFFLLIISLTGSAAGQTALGTGFTYQGKLEDGDAPANGAYDFRFTLYNSEANGSPVGSPLERGDVTVTGGYFTVTLDFGAVFTGSAMWLEVAVRPGASSGTYATLSPRQALTAAPYALFSLSAPWSGLTGVPAGFADGVDSDTTYTAGSGITLTGTSFSINSTYSQRRVSATCAVGSAIRAINEDGSVVCQADDPFNRASVPIPNTWTTLDSAGDVGQNTSLMIGADGFGLISYYDYTNKDLKVAHCTDTACTAATVTTLDSAGDVGRDTSLTIGADGLGLISYIDYTNADLKVAHCTNTACTAATVTTLDHGAYFSEHTSLTIGVDGLGLISYRGDGGLKVAHCTNTACTAATVTFVSGILFGGDNISITIGEDGLGLISHHTGDRALWVAHCSNINCTEVTDSLMDNGGDPGLNASVTIGADWLGLISYYDGMRVTDLMVAHCADTACTTGAFSTLDSAGDVGEYTSLTIGEDGLGLISYYDRTNGNLKVAHCANVACSTAVIIALDSAGDVGQYTSLTIGTDGLALISYYDSTNGDLKVVHCGSTSCNPYIRRR